MHTSIITPLMDIRVRTSEWDRPNNRPPNEGICDGIFSFANSFRRAGPDRRCESPDMTATLPEFGLSASKERDVVETQTGGKLFSHSFANISVLGENCCYDVVMHLRREIEQSDEFHFDPENGLTFDRWFSKYEDLFRQDGRSLDDAAKVKLLLRSLSVPVHEKFLNYLLPSHPRNFTCDVVAKLKQIFGQQKSLFRKRYDCLKLEKKAHRRPVQEFICGLKSTKDADVRTRLLSKLESDQADTINLEGLVTECQRLSNLKHDTALVEKKPTSSAVQAVRHSRKQPSYQQKSSADGKTPPSPCWQCGAMHFVKDCQFSKHTSKHGEKKTGAKKKPFNTKVIQTVQQVRSRRRFVTVIFNQKSAKLQLDCGSDITVISHRTWKMIGAPPSSPTSVEASTASGEPLELIGEFTCPITVGDTTLATVCYITSVADLNVMDWHFLTLYPEVFQDSLGHCTKTKISLALKQHAQPVFRPKRPVPFHAIQKVDEELDRLQRSDIITPVDFSDWAAPIVVVKKPGGKVRQQLFSSNAGGDLQQSVWQSNLQHHRPVIRIPAGGGRRRVQKLLTINTHQGLFRFNRLAPGVKSAPGAFQQLMAKMVAGLRGVEVFLDDILVHSKTLEEHNRILHMFFRSLREYGFHLRVEKCRFYQDQLKHLGLGQFRL
ncbi:uncharacterized protein K02A2.6-like [Aedes albopictus]|uniref:Reverse transcriptase domain-containing protein n=1 Tax=Aedes albopictus TaxID=7160 RepID=A0ABM1ZCH6_AEDAL